VHANNHRIKTVLIGASTGGPGHIQQIIAELPSDSKTAYIIAQHMGAEFIPSFIGRLRTITSLPVETPQNNTLLRPGHIYVCSGKTRLVADNHAIHFTHTLSETYDYNPDINTLFHSASLLSNRLELMGVILTGIGADGVDGCRQLAMNNVHCITESEESAIVDGMPARAREHIPTIEVAPLHAIVEAIREFSRT
jgi:two-component system chemotaxis response regulator CheB